MFEIQLFPFVFRVDKFKDMVKPYDDGEKIFYTPRSVYEFQPQLSEGLNPYTDTFINVNFPALVSNREDLCVKHSEIKSQQKKSVVFKFATDFNYFTRELL